MYTLDFLQCDQLISACLCAVTSVQELTDLTLRAVHARAACAVLLATPSVQDVKLPIPFLTSHNMIYIYIYVCIYPRVNAAQRRHKQPLHLDNFSAPEAAVLSPHRFAPAAHDQAQRTLTTCSGVHSKSNVKPTSNSFRQLQPDMSLDVSCLTCAQHPV